MAPLPNSRFCKTLHDPTLDSRPSTFDLSGLQYSRLELPDLRIQCRGCQGPGERLTSLGRVDDGVHPQPRGAVTRVRLMFVSSAYGFVEVVLFRFAELLSLTLELLDLDFHQRACRRVAAHHRIA